MDKKLKSIVAVINTFYKFLRNSAWLATLSTTVL